MRRESDGTIERMCETLNKAFVASPSITNWCLVCGLLGQYLFLTMQMHREEVFRDKVVRQAVGYLTLPPKRVAGARLLSPEEWEQTTYYSDDERNAMEEAFGELCKWLMTWAVSFGGDEGRGAMASGIWRMFADAASAPGIFKSPLGRTMFSGKAFEALAALMPEKPLRPRTNLTYLPMASRTAEEDYRNESLRLQRRTADGIELLARDACTEGQARARVGTGDEIRQENEILRRVRANGDRGLRGFVAQVLREALWQFAGGHKNTDEGRQRCYNRVYALMHPTRRRKVCR